MEVTLEMLFSDHSLARLPLAEVDRTILVIRLVTSRHMRCAKKEHLDMTTGKPGLPVSERTLRAFGHHRPSL